MVRNRSRQLLVYGDDSGSASVSEEGALPVGDIVLSLAQHKSVAIKNRILCVLLSSRNKDEVGSHSKEIRDWIK